MHVASRGWFIIAATAFIPSASRLQRQRHDDSPPAGNSRHRGHAFRYVAKLCVDDHERQVWYV